MLMNTRDGDLIPKKCFTAYTIGSTTMLFSQPPIPFMAPEIPDFRPDTKALPLEVSQRPAEPKGARAGPTTWEPIQPPIPLATDQAPDLNPDTSELPRPYSHLPAPTKGLVTGLTTCATSQPPIPFAPARTPLRRPATRLLPIPMNTFDGEAIPKPDFTQWMTGSTRWLFSHAPA